MKIWTSEHTFNDNWDTVTQAAFRKYPNPWNTSVVGVDVVDRSFENGVLKSHKLLTTEWNLPSWVRFSNIDTCHVSEHSEVDRNSKTLKLRSQNLTLVKWVSVDEQMEYKPHPEDPKNKTLMTKTNAITVRGIPMASYLENIMKGTMAEKAQQGIAAMDWMITKVKEEAQDLKSKATQEMSELQLKATHMIDDNRFSSL